MTPPPPDNTPRDGEPLSGPVMPPEQEKSEAQTLIGRGVLGGYAIAAMNALLAWYIFNTGYGVNEAAGDDLSIIAGSTLFSAVVAAVLAHRFGRRHSIWIPLFFLAWVVFDVVTKVLNLNGGPNAGYILIVGLVGFGLISGLRGALALRRSAPKADAEQGTSATRQ